MDEQLSVQAQQIGKVKRALRVAVQQLRTNAPSSKILQKLIAGLQHCPKMSPDASVAALSSHLRMLLASLTAGIGQGFRNELLEKARQCDVPCSAKPDLLTLGPFELIYDGKSETIELHYAKVPARTALPVDVDKVLAAANQLALELLDTPIDLPHFAAELEEAILISLVRKRASTRAAELRAELPAVHRELTFIRQGSKKAVSKEGFRDYPMARFVVEIARFIRSDDNIKADRSFRLETAVIENAGNRRQSVFIPKELVTGFGEGMYYQAVVLRQST
ncbi:MAG: hypothetical protein FJ276_26365 [Planctomycetes bacterium]|nr:hypothetical protein [Planctomycetota bacterium]